MIPSCFDNFIGVKDICPADPLLDPPTSGLYIEQLEGVSLEWAARGADSKDLTGANFIKESINAAILKTKEALFEEMRALSYYKPRADLGYQTIGDFDYLLFDAFSPAFQGVRAERTPDCNRYIWKIANVSVLTQTDQVVNLRIMDGSIVMTKTIETVGGVVATDYIDYTIKSKAVYIEVANGDFSQTKLDSGAPGNCCGRCQPVGNRYYKVHGWDGSKRVNETFGLKVDFNLMCDEWAFMCAIRHRLGLAVLYKTGEIMCRAQMYNETDNVQTLDPAIEAQKNFFKSEFQKQIKNVIQRLPDFIRSFDNPCFRCEAGRRVELMP